MKYILENDSIMSDRLSAIISKWPVFIVLAIIAFTLWGGFYTVDQGERVIVMRFGEVKEIAEPGFHVKIPYIESVKYISVRSTNTKGTFAIYSKDVQGAKVGISVNYSIDPSFVKEIYTKYGTGYETRIIRPQIITKSKDAFGRRNAVETIQSRDSLAKMILDELQEHFHDSGIFFQSIQIENIDFSDEYERSVEERMRAEVEVAKVQQNLARERINADMVRERAKGAADAKLAEADAHAKAITLVSAAEADAIRAKALALAENPSYIQYIQAEKWNGTLPTSMIPSGTIPILNMESAVTK